jgi:ferredoxin-NADP reductase
VALDGPPGAVEQAYSLCSSPHPPATEVEIAVREVSEGRASPVLARQVEEGDLLQVRGPFGFLTWTEDDAGPVGLVGAGTGVAPLLSIVRYAAARGLDVPMTMLCSSRNRESALLADELDALARRLTWLRVVHTFTRDASGGEAKYRRRIDAGMLAEVMDLAPRGAAAPETFYVAGPADMVLAVRAALGEVGVSDGAIHTEDHA